MTNEELIQALDRLKVQTGSLACLGCGYEHNCTTKGMPDSAGGSGAAEHFKEERRASDGIR